MEGYLVFGVGFNDLPEHKTKKLNPDGTTWRCPFYIKWHSMIRRCYSRIFHKVSPSYTECTVCAEWLIFSNFKSWMETQDWEGKDLDKDWLVDDNREYSPNTCIFLPKKLNNFLSNSKRGGVDFHKKTGKFRARVSNQFTCKTEHLGLFLDYDTAMSAYISRKITLAEELKSVYTEYSNIIDEFILRNKREENK